MQQTMTQKKRIFYLVKGETTIIFTDLSNTTIFSTRILQLFKEVVSKNIEWIPTNCNKPALHPDTTV